MNVFISSTFKDLLAEREGVRDALRGAQYAPWGMEFFVSEPSYPLDVALRELEACDAVVLIIGFKGGSLIPHDPTLTYTAAEFRRAMELHRPIFVFLKTEDGSWKNHNPPGPIRDALNQFKRSVDACGVTPAYFETVPELQVQALQAFQKWEALGRPGARKTFASHKEFFPPPPGPSGLVRLFDYEQTLHGRAKETQGLNDFLSGPTSVAVLPGRGGIGKSKVLRDWSLTLHGWEAIFLRDGAVWHSEVEKEIPNGSVLIILDDAHRAEHLEKLVALSRHVLGPQKLKLILSSRPSGISRVDSAIARRFDSTEVTRLPTLEKLTFADARSLAEEVLGDAHLHHAPALAAISEDTPLITVVGGRLIARGEIPPALLANEEAFRHAVFYKFVEEYERLLPGGSVEWRPLLDLIAAIAPLRPREQEFLRAAEPFLRHRPDEIVAAFDTLERHGLLLRGGDLVRIVPDLLSDFLLEGACLNEAGEATGYAQAVFAQFRSGYSTNVLRNLSQLDWRISRAKPGVSLLDEIWETINQELENGDAQVRSDVLESVAQAAIFQPVRVMNLVRTAMEREAQPVILYGRWRKDQKDVLERIPLLLRAVAYHSEFTEEAIRRLWTLTKTDKRAPNQYPDHPQRVIRDLASYGLYKPATFNDAVADIALRLVNEPDAFAGSFTPLDIADTLLAKEGEHSESDGLTFSLGSFPLNFRAVSHIRAKALSIVETALSSPVPRTAARAAQSLSNILAPLMPTFGRLPTSEENARLIEERGQALDIITRRARAPLPIPLARQLMSILRRSKRWIANSDLRARADALVDSIPHSNELLAFDALCLRPWDRDLEHADLGDADRAHAEVLSAAVEKFVRMYDKPSGQIQALERMISDAQMFGIDTTQSVAPFVECLCVDHGFLAAFIDYVLGNPIADLGFLVFVVLRALRHQDKAEYRRVGVAAAGHTSPHVSMGAANAVCFGPNLDHPLAEDEAILERLIAHPEPQIRSVAFRGLGRLGKESAFTSRAISLVLGAGIGDSARLAEDACEAFHPHSMGPVLSADQIRRLLTKLVPVSDIDGFYMGHFLSWAARAHPALVFAFTLDRHDFWLGLQQTSDRWLQYQVIPRGSSLTDLHALRESDDYAQFLGHIRDRLVNSEIEAYWLSDLFWAIGVLDITTLMLIDELLHSGDRTKLEAALKLIGRGPRGIALSRPHFAVHLIAACTACANDLGEYSVQVLSANALPRSGMWTPGQPPPGFVDLREKATSLANDFRNVTAGLRLFSEIEAVAVRAIENSLKRDAETSFH